MARFDVTRLILANFQELNVNCYIRLSTAMGGRHYIIRPLMVQYDLI